MDKEISVASMEADETAARDDAAQINEETAAPQTVEKTREPGDDGRTEQKRNQAKVDAALGKRLKAEREKLLKSMQEELQLAKAIREKLPGMTNDEILDMASRSMTSMEDLSREYLKQEAEIKKEDPDFDLVELANENPAARALLGCGASARDIYDFINLDKRIEEARMEGERMALERIRSRSGFPSTGHVQTGGKVSSGRFTHDEMNEIDRRLKRGEKVYLD